MQIKIAKSLGGGFAGTPEDVWGVTKYKDVKSPTVFFGVYGLPDFINLWKHTGKKYILWAGSDIQNFLRGYWLDPEGKMKIHPIQLSSWIDTYCKNYVENDLEQQALRTVGIRSEVVPSFLGNVNDFKMEYQHSEKPKVYTSVSGDDFKLYGWDKLPDLVQKNPHIDFYLYGNKTQPDIKEWTTSQPSNVHIKGRVAQEQMDEETKKMQGALRLTEFDGFSEIVAKSLLWGQYPISIIDYPHTFRPEHMEILHTLQEPNKKGRDWLLNKVNKYPWNTNI